MSQSCPSVAFPRFASWVGVVAAFTAFAGLAALSAPAQAQMIGSVGTQSSNGPNPAQQSAPLHVQTHVFMPGSQRTYSPPQMRPSFPQPQPVYPQTYRGSGVPVFQPSPYGNVFQHSPVGGSPQGYAPPSQPTVTPPNVMYRRFGGPGTSVNRERSRENPHQGNEPSRALIGRRIFPPISGHTNGSTPAFGTGGLHGSIHIFTPAGPRPVPSQQYDNNYIYAPATIVNGPSLLGGYYYGNYCDTYYTGAYCYPSVYSYYPGFPEYIVNPGVIVVGNPYYPTYETPYLPFSAPTYQVTYNQTNYYVANPARVQQIEDGGQTAHRALQNAYPEGSYQAAFGDIEKAWQNGDINLIRKHIRDSDTKLSVYFKGKYSYSIASGDFVQITRDAFDRLSTVSFEFTRLRKAKNGDVTAYGKHVYKTGGSSDASGDTATTGDTVPFSTDGSQPAGAQPYDRADDPAAGEEKTIYTSYTLRKQDDQWYIIGVDSSPTELVK